MARTVGGMSLKQVSWAAGIIITTVTVTVSGLIFVSNVRDEWRSMRADVTAIQADVVALKAGQDKAEKRFDHLDDSLIRALTRRGK